MNTLKKVDNTKLTDSRAMNKQGLKYYTIRSAIEQLEHLANAFGDNEIIMDSKGEPITKIEPSFCLGELYGIEIKNDW